MDGQFSILSCAGYSHIRIFPQITLSKVFLRTHSLSIHKTVLLLLVLIFFCKIICWNMAVQLNNLLMLLLWSHAENMLNICWVVSIWESLDTSRAPYKETYLVVKSNDFKNSFHIRAWFRKGRMWNERKQEKDKKKLVIYRVHYL